MTFSVPEPSAGRLLRNVASRDRSRFVSEALDARPEAHNVARASAPELPTRRASPTSPVAQVQPFEESARAPLIVRAPGRTGIGRACKSLVEFVHIYPTAAELGGLRGPRTSEGQSLAPLLDNPARAWKSAAFTQMYGPKDVVGRSVVNDRYRYMRWTSPHPDEEFYDHQSDPREFTNLARKPSHAQALRRL